MTNKTGAEGANVVEAKTEEAPSLLPKVSVLSNNSSSTSSNNHRKPEPTKRKVVKSSRSKPDLVDVSLDDAVEVKDTQTEQAVKKASNLVTNKSAHKDNPYKTVEDESHRQGRSRSQSQGKKRIILKRGTSHFTENLDKARKLYV